MAAKAKKSGKVKAPKQNLEQSDRLAEIRENYSRFASAEAENRRLFSDDLNFVFNAEDTHAQWDPVILAARRNRPSYTFNRMLQSVNMVYGDFQQVEPQLKVRAQVKENAISTAFLYEGLIRDIETASRARRAVYNPSFKYALGGGFGVWRIMPEYANDNSFDQVLRLKIVSNPLTAFWDPECTDPYRAGSMWGGLAENIGIETYKMLFPGFNPVPFEMSRDNRGWVSSKQVRVAEYFKRIPVEKKIFLLDDGRVIDEEMLEALRHLEGQQSHAGARVKVPEIKRDRIVKSWKLSWLKCDGFNILEGPVEYDWKNIPLIRCPGRFVSIEGRQKVQSLVRHSKDPQRTYNLHRSTMIESAALTPRAPYIATPKMIKAYEDMWATANTANRPYLLYDPDEEAAKFGGSGRPQREPPPDVPSALVALAQQDLGDMQAAVGYFDASLGSQVNDSDRTSGKALIARQRRGDLGSHEFLENFAGALEVTYDCLIDMIPTVYDTERVVRIMGEDNVAQYVTVNKSDGKDIMHSLKEGAFDVACTVGPGYATSRQDTLATLLDAAQSVPAIGQLAPDIVARNIDTKDADELARRVRIGLIRSGIVKPTEEEQQNMPPPPPPNPMDQLELARKQALTTRDQANAAVAMSKAQAGDLEHLRMIFETAQKHLDNLLTAKQLGEPSAAQDAEGQAATAARAAPQGGASATPGSASP